MNEQVRFMTDTKITYSNTEMTKCPYCGSYHYTIKSDGSYKCNDCNKIFYR